MKGRPKNNRQTQTHHWSCKSGRVFQRSLDDRYYSIPKSLTAPPPNKDKNKNKNHKSLQDE